MAAPGMDSAWFQDKKGRCWQVAIGGKVTDKVNGVVYVYFHINKIVQSLLL